MALGRVEWIHPKSLTPNVLMMRICFLPMCTTMNMILMITVIHMSAWLIIDRPRNFPFIKITGSLIRVLLIILHHIWEISLAFSRENV
jgi:hypothetical protein